MRDHQTPINEDDIATTEDLLARMRRIEAGEFFASDGIASAKAEHPLTKSEANLLRGEFFKLHKKLPRPACLAGVAPACARPPIQSHTVGRARALALLDDGTGHVLALESTLDLPPEIKMVRKGIYQASTFPGLCSHHDAELFRPIDTQEMLPPSDEQLFCLSHRAILHRLYLTRQSELDFAKFLKLAIKARDRNRAADFLAHLTRFRWGAQRLEAVAAFYSRVREAREWTGALTHLVGRNMWTLPFAVSSYFEPTFNPDGTRIEAALGPCIGPFVTLNVVPQADGSVAALSYPTEYKGKLDDFLSSFRPPIDVTTFVDRIWRAALLYCDNIIMSPRYWQAVPEQVQKTILAYAMQNPLIPHNPPGDEISLFAWITKIPREEASARLQVLDLG